MSTIREGSGSGDESAGTKDDERRRPGQARRAQEAVACLRSGEAGGILRDRLRAGSGSRSRSRPARLPVADQDELGNGDQLLALRRAHPPLASRLHEGRVVALLRRGVPDLQEGRDLHLHPSLRDECPRLLGPDARALHPRDGLVLPLEGVAGDAGTRPLPDRRGLRGGVDRRTGRPGRHSGQAPRGTGLRTRPLLERDRRPNGAAQGAQVIVVSGSQAFEAVADTGLTGLTGTIAARVDNGGTVIGPTTADIAEDGATGVYTWSVAAAPAVTGQYKILFSTDGTFVDQTVFEEDLEVRA